MNVLTLKVTGNLFFKQLVQVDNKKTSKVLIIGTLGGNHKELIMRKAFGCHDVFMRWITMCLQLTSFFENYVTQVVGRYNQGTLETHILIGYNGYNFDMGLIWYLQASMTPISYKFSIMHVDI